MLEISDYLKTKLDSTSYVGPRLMLNPGQSAQTEMMNTLVTDGSTVILSTNLSDNSLFNSIQIHKVCIEDNDYILPKGKRRKRLQANSCIDTQKSESCFIRTVALSTTSSVFFILFLVFLILCTTKLKKTG